MISVATYQRWEILRWLAVHDPEFMKEMEAAE